MAQWLVAAQPSLRGQFVKEIAVSTGKAVELPDAELHQHIAD
jgi:hypothetical protein